MSEINVYTHHCDVSLVYHDAAAGTSECYGFRSPASSLSYGPPENERGARNRCSQLQETVLVHPS